MTIITSASPATAETTTLRAPATVARELLPTGGDTILDRVLGPRRELAVAWLSLDEMRGAAHLASDRFGAHVTVNDILLAVLAGGLRTWLEEEGASGRRGTRVQVPVSLHGAKPMPKAGWSIATQIEPLAEPYQAHGRLIDKEVRTITWQGGRLPNEYFDEFSIQIRTPTQAGEIAIPVTQLCEKGRLDWAETPTAQTPREALEAPAPVIRIHPAAATPQHHH